ncbi:hypothetical protein K435DRAFT_803002 [Dendrothele bispora CBS 962.96]|uniref:Uncharacterized protein n=1 Tax=Dendrothele bispora (strain CBS 962.96) TaxID=1314807 RepID=A0A4S8LJ82_DENBC|nr:hypothetical protein K435DRAFT_806311 [Dendrothele bispora CBS 962.96]THU89081.1 hypothetical protein K435DRAFT_803002 [Dendrothele bispora CBS 962.96]
MSRLEAETWNNFDILKLQDDIQWKEKLPIEAWRQIDTDLLRFAPTCEQFVHVHGLRYAFTSAHTKEEYELFHGVVKAGGQWSASLKKLDCMSMDKWWSEQAEDAKHDKLSEHFKHYHTIWNQYHQTRQTLLGSQTQRQPHYDCVHAPTANYASHTLVPAKPLCPATQFQENGKAILANDPASYQMGNIDGFIFTQSSSTSPILHAQETVDMNISVTSQVTHSRTGKKDSSVNYSWQMS